eukprot:SAG22_NODE_315_length_12535_cov_3.240351_8_plen_128_part_00
MCKQHSLRAHRDPPPQPRPPAAGLSAEAEFRLAQKALVRNLDKNAKLAARESQTKKYANDADRKQALIAEQKRKDAEQRRLEDGDYGEPADTRTPLPRLEPAAHRATSVLCERSGTARKGRETEGRQ